MDSAENRRQMHVATVFLNIEGIKLIIYKWFMNDIKVFSTHDIHMHSSESISQIMIHWLINYKQVKLNKDIQKIQQFINISLLITFVKLIAELHIVRCGRVLYSYYSQAGVIAWLFLTKTTLKK